MGYFWNCISIIFWFHVGFFSCLHVFKFSLLKYLPRLQISSQVLHVLSRCIYLFHLCVWLSGYFCTISLIKWMEIVGCFSADCLQCKFTNYSCFVFWKGTQTWIEGKRASDFKCCRPSTNVPCRPTNWRAGRTKKKLTLKVRSVFFWLLNLTVESLLSIVKIIVLLNIWA